MTRYTTVLRMHPPRLADRLWYRKWLMDAPLATSAGRVEGLARLVPYKLRRFHRWFATWMRLFWVPCSLCGREFGGHECAGTVEDPSYPTGSGRGMSICGPCTKSIQQQEEQQ